MPAPYENAFEHVEDELELAALIFEHRARCQQARGTPFGPPGREPGEAVNLALGGATTSDETRIIDDLQARIDEVAERIERRLQRTEVERRPLPWQRLRSVFRLSHSEQQALWLLAAVEVSSRHRQMANLLDGPRIQADVGLLEACVYGEGDAREFLLDELGGDGPLLRHRLIEVTGGRRSDELPLSSKPLRVAPRVLELLHGRFELARELAHLGALVRPGAGAFVGDAEVLDEVRGLLRRALELGAEERSTPALVLVGAEGAGKRFLVAQAARELGRPLLEVWVERLPDDAETLAGVARDLVREALLFSAIPVLSGLDGLLGEARGVAKLAALDAALGDYVGPLVCVLRDAQRGMPPLARGVVRVDLELPSETERATLWRRALAVAGATEEEAAVVEEAAARYKLSGGLIHKAAAAGVTLARGRGATLTGADLYAGLRGVLDERMGHIATRITRHQRWEDLVVPEETLDAIRELISRVRHRRRVYEDWGFSKKLTKGLGVSALFAGPPGTGKTMVAGLLAAELELDLYQIDLSRIVSKYIGETEKNLSGLFDAAEAGHAILLFDEADSLFAKRTEVKSSVDRYANMEVNYLLQRMERFEGVTILTTNLESSIDAAFKRRLSFHLDFPFPEIDERMKLWQSMITAEVPVVGALDFKRLAKTYKMAGGNIRNAVLRAAFLAAMDGAQGIGNDHLLRAAELEYQGMGKLAAGAGMGARPA